MAPCRARTTLTWKQANSERPRIQSQARQCIARCCLLLGELRVTRLT